MFFLLKIVLDGNRAVLFGSNGSGSALEAAFEVLELVVDIFDSDIQFRGIINLTVPFINALVVVV